MKHYPIFLDLHHKPVLVIGGGDMALEKIINLRKSGAKITVIAPTILPQIRRFSANVTCVERDFVLSDISLDFILVFAATGDGALNERVSTHCSELRILCNTVDDPRWCHFIIPAILRRGAMTIAISTAGVSPSLAQSVRQIIADAIPARYVQLTRFLSMFSPEVRSTISTLENRKLFWQYFYRQNPYLLLDRYGIRTLRDRAQDWLRSFCG
jgi:precorrin-2 dehydrogenase / sirohydrochlorin ferrochelatase